jgi:hypothetical protein
MCVSLLLFGRVQPAVTHCRLNLNDPYTDPHHRFFPFSLNASELWQITVARARNRLRPQEKAATCQPVGPKVQTIVSASVRRRRLRGRIIVVRGGNPEQGITWTDAGIYIDFKSKIWKLHSPILLRRDPISIVMVSIFAHRKHEFPITSTLRGMQIDGTEHLEKQETPSFFRRDSDSNVRDPIIDPRKQF